LFKIPIKEYIKVFKILIKEPIDGLIKGLISLATSLLITLLLPLKYRVLLVLRLRYIMLQWHQMRSGSESYCTGYSIY
jgi:hypothetical protein